MLIVEMSLQVLATVCEELPLYGVFVIYLSASESSGHRLSSPSRSATSTSNAQNNLKNFESRSMHSEATSNSLTGFFNPSSEQSKRDWLRDHTGLHIGARGNGDSVFSGRSITTRLKVLINIFLGYGF